MPGRDITRLPNRATKFFLLTLALLAVIPPAVFLRAQPVFAQSDSKPAANSQTIPVQSSNPASGSTPAEPAPAQQGETAPKTDDGVYVFKKDVDEVLLHASVIDDHQHIVTDLPRDAFSVFEDGKPQNILSFRNEDIPVAMGILIDNSGSMREKRAKVNQAALNLVRASNPRDEVFIVNFNDEYYLDQDFTNDLLKLKEALDKIDTRGGTALYDAVVASADHLKHNARLEKKVLFVVTDGEDNASSENLELAVKQLQAEDGPSVYAIGILGEEEHPKRAKRALDTIAQRTGGIAFFPRTLDEVDSISKMVAHDIRNQYTIGYKPTNPRGSGGFRTVRVEAKSRRHSKLLVRTKSGYYAGPSAASASK
jgi:Ca-activated chloride channel homolog